MSLFKSKCRKHPHATEADALHEAIRLKKKYRLRSWPSRFYCDHCRAYHVKGPSIISRKNRYHADRRWEMLLSNPGLLTERARRAVGADEDQEYAAADEGDGGDTDNE
jgi:hypothetical protein